MTKHTKIDSSITDPSCRLRRMQLDFIFSRVKILGMATYTSSTDPTEEHAKRRAWVRARARTRARMNTTKLFQRFGDVPNIHAVDTRPGFNPLRDFLAAFSKKGNLP